MIKVGTCGWGFLKGGLKEYAKRFRVVEVNYTFYRYPRKSTLERWRKTVSNDFEFTVKAHKDITHRKQFENVEEEIRKLKEICEILDARVILFQTPKSFRDSSKVREFLEKYEFEENVVMELRGFTKEQREDLVKKYGIIDCTDLLKEDPIKSKFLYTRLHGLGTKMYRYKYTEQDLLKLKEKVKAWKEGYVMFNNIYMYEDAEQFLKLLSMKNQ
jgi:uncharacterized protein YecE (DUF72 family)